MVFSLVRVPSYTVEILLLHFFRVNLHFRPNMFVQKMFLKHNECEAR